MDMTDAELFVCGFIVMCAVLTGLIAGVGYLITPKLK